MEIANSLDLNMMYAYGDGIINLLLFFVCLFFVIFKPGADTILLGIGSAFYLLSSIFIGVRFGLLTNTQQTEYIDVNHIYALSQGIHSIGTISFMVGLLILMVKYLPLIKKSKLENNGKI